MYYVCCARFVCNACHVCHVCNIFSVIHIMSCHAMSCHTMLCVMLLTCCHAMSCYVMLCHAMSCYVMLCMYLYNISVWYLPNCTDIISEAESAPKICTVGGSTDRLIGGRHGRDLRGFGKIRAALGEAKFLEFCR